MSPRRLEAAEKIAHFDSTPSEASHITLDEQPCCPGPMRYTKRPNQELNSYDGRQRRHRLDTSARKLSKKIRAPEK